MQIKSDAKDILLEYLEQMMPVMETNMVKEFMGEKEVQYVFYEQFISEKLTMDKLDKMDKLDDQIILVVDWVGEFGEEKNKNYWILAPYYDGFVWVNKSKIKNMSKLWRNFQGLERWRKDSLTHFGNYVKKGKTLRQMLNVGFEATIKTFYLLNHSTSRSTITRTLNFSRGGFL